MVGVYDSGVGGLSVWKDLLALMPWQDYVYVADSANCPYGEKSPGFIAGRAAAVARFLIDSGADVVVVACNTATAAAISCLRQAFPVPFVGMEPAVKPAAELSRTGVVGVLATANTFRGRLYRDTVVRFASDIKVVEVVGRDDFAGGGCNSPGLHSFPFPGEGDFRCGRSGCEDSQSCSCRGKADAEGP